jgi:outer membrane murein-binding lipoprotein Lpp
MVVAGFFVDYSRTYYTTDEVFGFSTQQLISAFTFSLLFSAITTLVGRRFPRVVTRLLPKSWWTHDPDTDASKELQEAFANEIRYSETEAMVSNRLYAIQGIDDRINALRARSTWMLLAIGMLLIAAAITVVFAGSLTNLDVSAASDVDKISQDKTTIETRIAQLSEIGDLEKIISADIASKDAKDRAAKRLAEITSNDKTLSTGQSGIQIEIDAARTALEQDQKLLKEAWTKQLTSSHGYSDTRYLIATAITRIGVILVIVFLVQILIGLYRYNTRLITFYSSRHDALQLWDGKPATIEKLQKIMSPNIDFGREPKHPLEDLVRQLIAKIHVPGTGASG